MRFVYGVTSVVAGRRYLVYVAADKTHSIALYDALSQFWHFPGQGCVGPGRVSAFWELDATTGVTPDREQAVAEPPRAFVGPNAALVLETPAAPAAPAVRPSTGRGEAAGGAPTPMLMQPPPSPSRFALLEVD
jgi:hypothetical protein